MDKSNGNDQMVLDYLNLRKAVGELGVILPVVLPIGVFILGSEAGFQDSISAYHGTIMRGVFVGILFSIGLFLYSYKGYSRRDSDGPYQPSDNVAGNLACVFALGVALFPITSGSSFVRTVHFVAATAMFLTLAYFSYYLFTKTGEGETPEGKKKTRNNLYEWCGRVIVACIVLIAVFSWFLDDSSLASVNPVYWLETLALWTFGLAWFVKGEGLKQLNDRKT